MESLHRTLKDQTRRRIIVLLHDRPNLSYTELIGVLQISNTGKLNYHLKVLGDLLSKTENGGYVLTEKGMTAFQLLQQFPDKPSEKPRLGTSEIILIGLLGFILTFTNPFLWGAVFVGTLIGGIILLTFYATFVPAAVIWLLVEKRIRSHDLYELCKPATVPISLFTLLFILLFIFEQQLVGFFGFGLVLLGYAPLLGIAVIEALYRLTHKI